MGERVTITIGYIDNAGVRRLIEAMQGGSFGFDAPPLIISRGGVHEVPLKPDGFYHVCGYFKGSYSGEGRTWLDVHSQLLSEILRDNATVVIHEDDVTLVAIKDRDQLRMIVDRKRIKS